MNAVTTSERHVRPIPSPSSPTPSLLHLTLCIAGMLALAACGSTASTQEGGRSAASWGQGMHEADSTLPRPVDPNLKAKIYRALAEMSTAEATGQPRKAEDALEEAMEGVRTLARQEGALDDPEMRQLYRSVITAYERYYGVSDTLMTEYGDIFAFREEMFAAMNALEEPLLEDVFLPEEAKAVAATIPLETNQLVEQSVQYLLRTPDRHLYHWLSRAETYFPMIEQILREEGLPDEVKYLAMIESGLNPRARSHAGAGGMWQFMPATGRAYGLRITHWIDERWDPEKSTRAAARHLKDLYEQFGDWHLALAAYNCGSGRVSRAVRAFEAREGRKAGFWDIYENLPRETRNYVPMYIAATMVASRPDAFDLDPVEPGPHYVYDVVEVEGMLDLRTAAEMAGTSVDMIRALNPEIRQWTTPPSQTPYRLRVPPGSHGRFTQAYAALPPERKQGPSEYQVRRGDTLGKIARRYSTSVAALQEMNDLRGTLIREGQTLYVPVQYDQYAGAAAATDGYEVSYERTPVRTTSLAASTPRTEPETTSPERSTRVRYHVRRGDNLTKIADRYGISVAEIKSWNDLRSDQIYSGQTLTLYTGSAPAPAQETVYRVQRGDNLTEIARRYGVTVSDLRAWNNLRTDRIYSGQRLKIGGGRSASAGEAWVAYYVRHGDNLTEIANRYGVTVSDLRKWNALRSDRLQVGQKLAVYTR